MATGNMRNVIARRFVAPTAGDIIETLDCGHEINWDAALGPYTAAARRRCRVCSGEFTQGSTESRVGINYQR